MRIIISGVTGFTGTALSEQLVLNGHEVTGITRDPETSRSSFPYPIDFISWQDLATTTQEWDIYIHLAGASVADKRWSAKQKKILYKSRIDTGKIMVDCALRQKKLPIQFLCASATGIYGDQKDLPISEKSNLADDFLAKLCKDWEAITKPLEDKSVICSHLRSGIILGCNEGALNKLVLLSQLGLLSSLGSGKQYMPWIHIEDWVNAVLHIIHKNISGPINMVYPASIRQNDFFKVLSHHFKMWQLPKVPQTMVKLIFGEMSQILLDSQNITSSRLTDSGFHFQFNSIKSSLDNLYPDPSTDLILRRRMIIPQPVEKLFPFFSDAKNLEKLTPKFLNFKVTSSSDERVKKNTIINYVLKIHGIPIRWRTRILDFEENSHFIDNQESGPYKRWHHLHKFESCPAGTLMTDIVRYNVGYGILGKWIAFIYVTKDVNKIFNYRTEVLQTKNFNATE